MGRGFEINFLFAKDSEEVVIQAIEIINGRKFRGHTDFHRAFRDYDFSFTRKFLQYCQEIVTTGKKPKGKIRAGS